MGRLIHCVYMCEEHVYMWVYVCVCVCVCVCDSIHLMWVKPILNVYTCGVSQELVVEGRPVTFLE